LKKSKFYKYYADMIYTNKRILLATLNHVLWLAAQNKEFEFVRLFSNRSWLSTNESAWILNVTYIHRVYKKGNGLRRAIASELLCVWPRFFHIRKNQALSVEYVFRAKWITNEQIQIPIKNVSQNRIFSPLRVIVNFI
jgi:hypothetical protein